MDFDTAIADLPWRPRVVLRKLADEGATLIEAAAAAGVCRQRILKWRGRDAAFDELVKQAREIGAEKRARLLWLRHPFRGKRPPSGKGHGGKPKFSYGR
jgi:hypothetical protein